MSSISRGNKCKQCGNPIGDKSTGFCSVCGATVLSKKSKKSIICHTLTAGDIVRLVFVVIFLLAACVYSVWNIKHLIEYKEQLQPNYEIGQQLASSGENIPADILLDYNNYKLADIYRTYGSPVIFGVNALTAVAALLMLARLKFSYMLSAVLNVIGFVLLAADTLCSYMYNVEINYIYAFSAIAVRFVLIFMLASYAKKAGLESARRRKRKDTDTSGTVDMYDTSMFYGDIASLKRKAAKEGQPDFEVRENVGSMGEVTLISRGTPAKAAPQEEQKPAVPVAKAEPKKKSDLFGDSKELDAVAQLAAAVGELEESVPVPSAPVENKPAAEEAPKPVAAEKPVQPAAPVEKPTATVKEEAAPKIEPQAEEPAATKQTEAPVVSEEKKAEEAPKPQPTATELHAAPIEQLSKTISELSMGDPVGAEKVEDTPKQSEEELDPIDALSAAIAALSNMSAPVEKPAAPVEKPVAPVEKPAAPVEKPVTPVEKPVAPVEKPVAPVEKPAAPVEKPVAPVEKPVAPVEKPVAPAEQPAAPAEKPVAPVEKPVAPVEKPVAPVEKPVAPVEKPAAPAEKPVAPVEQPVKPIHEKKDRFAALKKTFSFKRNNYEEYDFDDADGITDQEPIPLNALAAAAQAQSHAEEKPAEEELTEEQSTMNRSAGPWQCTRCGQMNFGADVSCMSCGAKR